MFFVQAPYTAREASSGELVFEEVLYNPGGPASTRGYSAVTPGGPCHIGLSLKTREKGDGIPSQAPINNAAAQVLKGMNGLVNHMFAVPRVRGERTRACRFIPVVFTTAELWVSDVDLRDADLASGEAKVENVTQVKWLWFNHNQSTGLRHDVNADEVSADLALALRREFCRTIAIVSAAGVEEFLGRNLESWLDDFA